MFSKGIEKGHPNNLDDLFIFKRVSEMEAERSEGLHFRTSAENTGSIPRSLLRN